MALRRRTLLKAAGATALAASPLALLFRRTARADAGPLTADSAGLLDLPAGFRYRILDHAGDAMSDGLRVPERPDGMACFAGPDGTLILMRNHELETKLSTAGYDAPPSEAYDASAVGGVTRLVLKAGSLERVSSIRVLTGTLRNCAGGPSPWGWLTCEESVKPGHGYVFNCRTDAARLAKPERLTGYGRFNHEAICIDPKTLTAYMTEDRGDGCVYRYRPADRARPHSSGKLQALRIKGSPGLDTGKGLEQNKPLAVDWVDIPRPDPKDDDVRKQAAAQGAASFRRGEGITFHDGAAYVCATVGGQAECGQIFRLVPGAPDTLELLAESPASSVLDMPDNLCITPWGDAILCEDGPGEQYLRGLTPQGLVYDIARNASSKGELAGVCLSPDGAVMFVNLQAEGITLAITGTLPALAKAATRAARRAT